MTKEIGTQFSIPTYLTDDMIMRLDQQLIVNEHKQEHCSPHLATDINLWHNC